MDELERQLGDVASLPPLLSGEPMDIELFRESVETWMLKVIAVR